MFAMASANLNLNKWPRPVTWVAVSVFAVDRLLKHLAINRGASDGGAISFGLFMNRGLAFSLPLPAWAMASALGAASLGLGCAVLLAWRKRPDLLPAFAFIGLGAASNLYDRLAHGAVIDYVVFFWGGSVNLADAMIVGGLAWVVLTERRRTKEIEIN